MDKLAETTELDRELTLAEASAVVTAPEPILSVRATLRDRLCLRTPLGDADAPDGTHYDVSVTLMGGAILVAVYPPKGSDKPRKQYVITCEELVNAIDRIERKSADVAP